MTHKQDDGWTIENLPRPCVFIQWKGTDACLDFYCPCGEQCHVDADFAYAVECPHCGKLFQLKSVIVAREVSKEEWGDAAFKRGDP